MILKQSRSDNAANISVQMYLQHYLNVLFSTFLMSAPADNAVCNPTDEENNRGTTSNGAL
jgi:hypothetical protein